VSVARVRFLPIGPVISAQRTDARAAASAPSLCALTLDLEPDCGGWVDSFDTLARVQNVVELLRTLDVPVTVFVAGRVFEVRPEAVRALAALRHVEFGVHGYAHDPRRADNQEEIRRGFAAFRRFFSTGPAGFRAPEGRISPGEFALLQEQGVVYDSSVFPTWRPGAFNYLGAPNTPFRDAESGLPELTITVLRPIPIPLGLGYMRVLGPTVTRQLLRRAQLPRTVVVAFHVHDLFGGEHTARGPRWLQWYLGWNVHTGPMILSELVATLRRRDYRFVTMRDLVPRAQATYRFR
jgi:peptidoglycan/xylan/chitin deacetylase (PgdA/CDA1 family)